MKRIIYGIQLLALVGTFVVGCQKENLKPNLGSESSKEVKTSENDLNNLIKSIKYSEDYLLLKKSFDKIKDKALEDFIDLSNVDWENPINENNEDGSFVILFNVYAPDMVLIGNLISFNKDESSHLIFESFEEFNMETGGFFNYYFQTYESKLSVSAKVEKGKILIGTVLNEPDYDYANSWWACTTNCYKRGSDACDSDPECKTLCDGLGGLCTGAIMISCGIHCL